MTSSITPLSNDWCSIITGYEFVNVPLLDETSFAIFRNKLVNDKLCPLYYLQVVSLPCQALHANLLWLTPYHKD